MDDLSHSGISGDATAATITKGHAMTEKYGALYRRGIAHLSSF